MPEQKEGRVPMFPGIGNERVWCVNTQQRGQPDGSSVSKAG